MRKFPGVIPARMASSRFPGKPLTNICGKPMIQWVFDHSKKSSCLSDVYVATDHEEIAAYCDNKKIPYLMTSPTHKNCAERTNEVCQRLGSDFIVEIQGDEPTLMAEDIDDFIRKSFTIDTFDLTILYSDLPAEYASEENIVKLVCDSKGRALFFSRCPIPLNFKTKAKSVKYFKQIGLYLWRSEALRKFSETPVGYLESIEDTHMLRLIEYHFDTFTIYTQKDTVGVDVPEDVQKAENFIIQHRL